VNWRRGVGVQGAFIFRIYSDFWGIIDWERFLLEHGEVEFKGCVCFCTRMEGMLACWNDDSIYFCIAGVA
jgi:hypothetical protein